MVKLRNEFSLVGNNEFDIKELEAENSQWICLSSHVLKESRFFYFWSKPNNAQAMPAAGIVAELERRLHFVRGETDRHKLKDCAKFNTPGWEQWSFGTPSPIGDYLYGAPAAPSSSASP